LGPLFVMVRGAAKKPTMKDGDRSGRRNQTGKEQFRQTRWPKAERMIVSEVPDTTADRRRLCGSSSTARP